jgi:hypothetical protein
LVRLSRLIFFDYFSKAISMAHSSFAPPDPHRNGVLAFINFVLVGDVVLMGVREGLCLLWSVMVCQWSMRMVLGVFAVNEEKGAGGGAVGTQKNPLGRRARCVHGAYRPALASVEYDAGQAREGA